MTYTPYLKWIETQQESMYTLLEEWASISSGSYNLEGLEQMATALKKAFSSLHGVIEEISLEPQKKMDLAGSFSSIKLGNLLSIKKRMHAPLRLLFVGHMDTVYDKASPFQNCTKTEGRLVGPGVADLKGGLVVLLTALQAFEQSPFAPRLGWTILINPDEEIGSPGSAPFLIAEASHHHLGLLFEPCFPDGSLVVKRKGSANYTFLVRGKAAHVGREFNKGRSAIHALAHLIYLLEKEMKNYPSISFNVGHLHGGGPVNVVSDQALCRLNIRVETEDNFSSFEKIVSRLKQLIEVEREVTVVIDRESCRPPKPLDSPTALLFKRVQEAGKEIGMDINGVDTGGVCDGNLLSAAGLTNLDTLGVQGGNLHTHEEYIELKSLKERATLVALLLMKLASDEELCSLVKP